MRNFSQHRRAFFYFLILSGLCAVYADRAVASHGSNPLHGNAKAKQSSRPPRGYARPPHHVKRHSVSSPVGFAPAQIRHAYGFDSVANQGQGQVIAIIDAYDDPYIESDLGVFDSTFGLPTCTSQNLCFQKIYASGRRPKGNAGWALEIALDVEWAHAIAPQARILLVEAASNSFTNLMQAVDVAVQNGANVVSMSFGGYEFSDETSLDSHFKVQKVTFVASSGDSGNGVEYPAASPWVVAVGGTSLKLDANGNYLIETAWSGSGGGISAYEPEPTYQQQFQITADGRGVPDVAYVADPNTGVAVYDSYRYQGQKGWFEVGGTSAGAPQWAALAAIANAMRASANRAPLSGMPAALYGVASAHYARDFHDIASGSNGHCDDLCQAGPGYDFVTGLGSPQANNLLPDLTAY